MQHGGENRAEWYKVLPKPQNFEPQDREQELSGFRDWFWSLEQYIVAVDSNYAGDLTYIRNHLDEELPLVEQTTEKTKRSAFLYGLLASLVKSRPLMLLKGVEQGNGLEAVRQLFRTCQPSLRNRSLALLQLIMQWPNFDMRAALLPQILKLEDSFREYEKIASPLADELHFAVLMKCLSGQLKTYLQVTLKDSTTYEELRESALRFDTSTIRWTQSMSLGAPVSALQVRWMWIELKKEKERSAAKASLSTRAKTKEKVSRNPKIVVKRAQILEKAMEISSQIGVQKGLHGTTIHGAVQTMVLERAASPTRVANPRMLEKEKIPTLVIYAEVMDTLQETAE